MPSHRNYIRFLNFFNLPKVKFLKFKEFYLGTIELNSFIKNMKGSNSIKAINDYFRIVNIYYLYFLIKIIKEKPGLANNFSNARIYIHYTQWCNNIRVLPIIYLEKFNSSVDIIKLVKVIEKDPLFNIFITQFILENIGERNYLKFQKLIKKNNFSLEINCVIMSFRVYFDIKRLIKDFLFL